jgi:hypothetical protein
VALGGCSCICQPSMAAGSCAHDCVCHRALMCAYTRVCVNAETPTCHTEGLVCACVGTTGMLSWTCSNKQLRGCLVVHCCREYIVWADSAGKWHCLLDRCPHRLATLSDGFIDRSRDEVSVVPARHDQSSPTCHGPAAFLTGMNALGKTSRGRPLQGDSRCC